ncbi:MAG: PKD domain-containing protein [Reichenbachiella sp.]
MKFTYINRILSLGTLCGFFLLVSCEEETVDNPPPEKVDVDASVSESLIVHGDMVTFEDNSSLVESRVWTFEGGTPETSSDPMVDVSYEFDGSYKASLKVDYSTGLSEFYEIPIKVLPDLELIVGLSVDDSDSGYHISAEDVIEFTDLSEGEPDTWSWSFAGGTPATSTDQNPAVQYLTQGVFDVSLNITRMNPDGSSLDTVITELVNVNPVLPVLADFSVDKYWYLPGETAFITDKSFGSRDTWEWAFEGGLPETSGDENPEVYYANPGIYNVHLTAYKESFKDKPGYPGSIDSIAVYVRTAPYVCDDATNLIACGNNDGESEDLTEWVANTLDDNFDYTEMSQIGRSTTITNGGTGSITVDMKAENGLHQLRGVKFVVETEASYTFSGDMYAETEDGAPNAVMEMCIVEASGNNSGPYRGWKNANNTRNQWSTESISATLPPGEYNVGFRHYGGKAKWHYDNLTVTKD